MKNSDADERLFSAEQNARVIKNAEKYYRTMMRADDESWNVRDRHMLETLERLLEYHGKGSRAVVWAHNTHIGDARATLMAAQGMVNIGQLAREKLGEHNVVLVGFGSYEGSVIAGSQWGAPMQVMPVPPARRGSWEYLFHQAALRDSFLITRDMESLKDAKRGHRAIGVVYDSDYEVGNYVPTDLARRYDAFVYLDETEALEPLPVGYLDMEEVPETFPSGE
jgi:erythromycin esterase-like protein